jgi:hypothetical protein
MTTTTHWSVLTTPFAITAGVIRRTELCCACSNGRESNWAYVCRMEPNHLAADKADALSKALVSIKGLLL